MPEPLVRSERRGAIALLTLNRPDKLNAVNVPMIEALDAALDAAEADETVRAIVLAGAGRAFSAGFDLDMGVGDGKPDPADVRRALENDFRIIVRFWDCPKPTIAAVHGYCLGSAMELALACDLTIAADDCRFGVPEVKFGSGIVAMLLAVARRTEGSEVSAAHRRGPRERGRSPGDGPDQPRRTRSEPAG